MIHIQIKYLMVIVIINNYVCNPSRDYFTILLLFNAFNWLC